MERVVRGHKTILSPAWVKWCRFSRSWSAAATAWKLVLKKTPIPADAKSSRHWRDFVESSLCEWSTSFDGSRRSPLTEKNLEHLLSILRLGCSYRHTSKASRNVIDSFFTPAEVMRVASGTERISDRLTATDGFALSSLPYSHLERR